MNLTYVAYSALDLQSANSVQTFNTVRALSARLGDSLTVIVPRFGSETAPFPAIQLPRVPINKLSRLIPNGSWSYWERQLFASRARRYLPPAHLIYTRDLLCADTFVRAGLPVLYEVHDLEARHPSQQRSENLRARLARADERAIRGARGVVSLTDTFRQELLALGWQAPDRIFVIPDSFDETVYTPRPREVARHALNLPQTGKLVVYAGLTFKYRGLDLLLSAFARWQDPLARLILVGGRDAEIRELQAQAQSLAITDRVQFIERKPSAVIANYFAAADALVIPDTVTDSTASPLKLFEYMAMARPIVCVDRAALREILGDAALYFPVGDALALANALRRATDPASADLGARAHARSADYTYTRRADKIIAAATALCR